MIDPCLASAALLTPPWLIDSRSVPIHPALLLNCGLRDYQWLLLLRVAAAMRAGYRRVLVVAPTGAGKTVLAAALMQSAATLGHTSEFVVHRKELTKQTSQSFTERGLPHGFITSSDGFHPDTITLAGVQSLARRLDQLLPPHLVILDEAHHAVSPTFAKVLESYPDAYVLGLTATPQRLDGRGLGEQFDIIIEGPSVAELIRRGFLSPFDYYAPTTPDMSGVHTVAGEFNIAEAAAVVDKPKLIGDVVEHYMNLCPGEQGIVFGASREHSRHLAEAFTAAGIRAMYVDGKMPTDERDWFDVAFRAGEVQIGCNVGLFGEGYDVPNVSYVGMAAPWRSLVNHRQACGRALRLADGKTRAVLCDHAGNAVDRQLGLPDDDVEWSLEGRAKRKRGVSDDAEPVTQCKLCYRVYPSSVRTCPGCGDERPVQARSTIKQEDGTLSKLEREEMKRRATARRKDEERACMDFQQFVSLARARGYDKPRAWARIQCGLRRIPVPPS